jgi:hypothetical protein
MANNRIYKKEVIEVYSAVDFKIFYDKIFSESLIRSTDFLGSRGNPLRNTIWLCQM